MHERTRSLLPTLSFIFAVAGCTHTIDYPDRYKEFTTKEEPQKVDRASAIAARYHVPGQEDLRVEWDESSVTRGMGQYEADLNFTLHMGDRERFVCKTRPFGPNIPETRFGCWSEQGSEAVEATHTGVVLWMAPERRCAFENFEAWETLRRPDCWEGTLTIGERTYTFDYAQTRGGAVVSEMAWYDEARQIVHAADFLTEWSMYYWPSQKLAATDARWLTVASFAQLVWYHAQLPD